LESAVLRRHSSHQPTSPTDFFNKIDPKLPFPEFLERAGTN